MNGFFGTLWDSISKIFGRDSDGGSSNVAVIPTDPVKLKDPQMVHSNNQVTLESFRDPNFKPAKLEKPEYYFSNPNTVAMLKAALSLDLDSARKFKTLGGDPNDEGPMADRRRLRVLHYAVAARNADAIKILKDLGADAELDAKDNGNAVIFAVYLDDSEAVKALLDAYPIGTLSISSVSRSVTTALASRLYKSLEAMLDKGLSIDFANSIGDTLVVSAMSGREYDLADWLILRGASVNVVSRHGVTPANSLERALARTDPNSETAKKLLKLQEQMRAHGAVFPAPTAEELRAKMKGQAN